MPPRASPSTPPTSTINGQRPLPRALHWAAPSSANRIHANLHRPDPDFDPRPTDTPYPSRSGYDSDSDSDRITLWPASRTSSQHRSPSPTWASWVRDNAAVPRPNSRAHSGGLFSPGNSVNHWPESHPRSPSPTFARWVDDDGAAVLPRGSGSLSREAFADRQVVSPPRSPSPTWVPWDDGDFEVPSPASGALFSADDLEYEQDDMQADTNLLLSLSRIYRPAPSEEMSSEPPARASNLQPESEPSLGQLAEKAAVLLEELSQARVHDDTKSWEMINSAFSSILKVRSELRVKVARKEGGKDPAQEGGENMGANSSCILCYRRSADTVLRPCAHLVLCSLCVGKANIKGGGKRKWAAARCPVCQQVITSTVKTFRG